MIRMLDRGVAEKIAAGEVVERPLSIVKELVENAVDAGASAITVEIRNGGKSYIRVTDNGCGIARDEAELAFMRHATSKIASEADLDRIETLGFRGEALASIAAVSRCELITKTEDGKTGTHLLIEGAETLSNTPAGCPDGTTVIVSDLFFNTPARSKFMKSDSAESGLVTDFISKMAVAYPDVRMRLINGGNIIFSTRGEGDMEACVLAVYGSDTGKGLVRVGKSSGSMSARGYVSKQGQGRATRKMQVFFVNGRWVSSKAMEKGVSDAYADKLTGGRHPVCLIFLETLPEKLDVNIHPNKKEVRFDDEGEVTEIVRQAISEALTDKEAMPEVRLEYSGLNEGTGRMTVAEQVDINNILSTMRQEEAGKTKAISPRPAAVKLDLGGLAIVGSAFSTYILALDDDTIYLIDQHAAHERVFYESLMSLRMNGEKARQMLMLPFLTDVPAAAGSGDEGWLGELRETGFEIEEFGGRAFIVKAIPAFMSVDEAKGFLTDFLDNVTESTDFESTASMGRIMTSACRSAVKAGDALSEPEVRRLLSDLAKCENPFNCPHGRPTFVKLSRGEVERMFKRR